MAPLAGISHQKLALLVGGWWFIGRRILTNQLFDQYTASLSDNIDFSSLRERSFQQSLTEDEINDYIGDALPTDMGPVEDLWIELYSGGIEVHIQVYGLENTIRASVKKWRRGVLISEARAEGLVGWVLEPAVLVDRIEKLVNSGLDENNVALIALEITSRGLSFSVAPR